MIPAVTALKSPSEPTEDGDVEETVAAALDQDFYLRSYPEVAGQDPVRHFLVSGHDAGLNPTAEFDTRFYLSRSPDVVAAGVNGFYHYLRWGRVEGRAPNPAAVDDAGRPTSAPERLVGPHVDTKFYLGNNPGIARTNVNAAKHYLHFGWHADLDPSPTFSTAYYRSCGYDSDHHENPLHHYLRIGRARGRLPRPLFAGGADMLLGPDVEAALRPHFDDAFYQAMYGDALDGSKSALADYIEQGWAEGRDPTPWFSTSEYLDRFPDVRTIGVNPFLHWLLWGRDQGFPPAAGPAGVAGPVRAPKVGGVSEELRPFSLPHADPNEQGAPVDLNRLDVHWIIPDVIAPGRGGHMTLFRLVRWLEAFGHRCTVWVNDPHPDWDDQARSELVQRSYQAISADIRVLASDTRFPADAVVIATSWTTALVLDACPSARNRFYLVQDDERLFHPAGTKQMAADHTYDLDMGYLCAGEWLARTLARERGRWARSFDLPPDGFQPVSGARPVGARPRIAFYARASTERRAVELGWLALEQLAGMGVSFEAHAFGSDTPLDQAPFPVVDHGVLDSAELAELYSRCDLGLCFSATNHSLIPQEMMAAGLPVVELDAPSTRAVFPDGVVTLAEPRPDSVASAVAGLLSDANARRAQVERARDWIAGKSWEVSARAVERAILDRLRESQAPAAPSVRADRAEPLVSVLIPTLNGGVDFGRVLAAVLEQRTPWPFEVVVIDSMSNDGTWELVRDHPTVRARQISRDDFQHGRTRNQLAVDARGEFLAYLTQDAQPAGPLWLADMVGVLQRHPRAAGAFGRHLPRPDASAFTRRDLHGFFRHLRNQPLERSKFLDLQRWRSGDEGFRRELHFFSSNNSLLRRSVWERHPLPEVDYGEDQLWAATVLAQRYSLVFAPTAAVIHSHEYDEASRFERSRIEGRWFRTAFGYDVVPADLEAHIARMNAGDARWAARNGVGADELELKMRLNRAEMTGLAAGYAES